MKEWESRVETDLGISVATTRARAKKAAAIATLIEMLERHRQRATYGAVGGVVGLPAQSVMQGQIKNHRNSWVVSAKQYVPTGYDIAQCHPDLKRHDAVIHTPAALLVWMKAHP